MFFRAAPFFHAPSPCELSLSRPPLAYIGKSYHFSPLCSRRLPKLSSQRLCKQALGTKAEERQHHRQTTGKQLETPKGSAENGKYMGPQQLTGGGVGTGRVNSAAARSIVAKRPETAKGSKENGKHMGTHQFSGGGEGPGQVNSAAGIGAGEADHDALQERPGNTSEKGCQDQGAMGIRLRPARGI